MPRPCIAPWLRSSASPRPDTSVRRAGIDPSTDARYLEELAFEVVSEQSRRDITERAEDLARRGVRRLIAIFVKQSEKFIKISLCRGLIHKVFVVLF